MDAESHTSARAPEPVGPYVHYRRAGGLLFLSGIGPRVRGATEVPGVTLGPDGRVARYDFERQCRYAYKKLKKVLARNGATMADVIKQVTYVTDARHQK